MNFYQAPFYTRAQLGELNENEVHFPFSDDDATYDGIDHQYVHTSKYFQERGRNLEVEVEGNQPDIVKQFLRALRRKVYTYIYTNNKSTRQQLNYKIAKGLAIGYSPYEYRQAFLEFMFMEGCYLHDNGDISAVAGVDLDTMQNMSNDVVRNQNRDFHKDAIGGLKTLGLNFYGKYSIMPQGKDW